MFTKLLIANRGEIARRIIKTCKKLNVHTVAVYSEVDQHMPFVKEADEAFLLGEAKPQESYNNIDKLIAIAKTAGCEAIHPGYGFLSENAAFAARCKEEGIVFIGPSVDVIAKMGDKIEARKLMEKAGLPLVPGISFPLVDVEQAIEEALKIGFPIMLKASAGGGGIGMGAVKNEEELRKAFEGHKRRAATFFNNDDMFLEKLIINPRHIEIQVLADRYGNCIYLWERECSIQRRNQKVIEEAPSPFISPEKRREMGEAAVAAAKAIGYENAGTFEFIVDENQNYYFLEMNTRLQVEHPVTETITGIDLVEQQLLVAYGETLALVQDEIALKGHAIEARIYSEDPKTFYPSPGKITKLQLPNEHYVRHDIGIEEGGIISPFYDAMFAKIIVTGDTREECIQRMLKVVDEYKVEGIKTNLSMIKAVIDHPAFKNGETTTAFVERYYLNKEGSMNNG